MTRAEPDTHPALAPVEAALAVVRRRRGPAGTDGLAPGLVVPDPAGWIPAADVVAGDRLDDLLAVAARRWEAPAAAAAALAWRSYTYWLAMPVVLGWATARRVPLVDPADVLLRFGGQDPLLTIGLRRLRLAVLPDDPVASAVTGAAVTVAADEEELRGLLRATLRARHLDPLLAQIQRRVRLGTRTLLGSLASAVAYAAVRGLDTAPGEVADVAGYLLADLDVADLVELPPGPDGHPTVQRLTCCLAFTLPEPKICSGCCLRR
jgi:hypothetical protein